MLTTVIPAGSTIGSKPSSASTAARTSLVLATCLILSPGWMSICRSLAGSRQNLVLSKPTAVRPLWTRVIGRTRRWCLQPTRAGEQAYRDHAEDEPADVCEERDTAPVCRGAKQPEVRLDQLVQEPQPEEDPGGDVDEEDGKDPGADPGAGVQQEVRAQHGGDGAAGPQVWHLRVGGGAEQQGHRGLRHHCGEAAGEIERKVSQRPEGILNVLTEDRQEQHVAQDVIPAAVH